MKKSKESEPKYIFKATSNMGHDLLKAGIKIYPEPANGFSVIVVENNGKYTPYNKQLKQAEVNEALDKTVVYWYNKLKGIENGK